MSQKNRVYNKSKNRLGIIVIGKKEDLLTKTQEIRDVHLKILVSAKIGNISKIDNIKVEIQTSAHGRMTTGVLLRDKSPKKQSNQAKKAENWLIDWEKPQIKVAPGQSIVFYDDNPARVIGSALAK